MYILEGQRVRLNKEIYKEYPEDERAVAEFEYDVTKPVAQFLVLYRVMDGDMNKREQIDLYYRN